VVARARGHAGDTVPRRALAGRRTRAKTPPPHPLLTAPTLCGRVRQPAAPSCHASFVGHLSATAGIGSSEIVAPRSRRCLSMNCFVRRTISGFLKPP